jgi:hypothetical protein
MTAVWFASGNFIGLWCILYLALLLAGFYLCFRKGHFLLFIFGFFFPLLWFVGAILPNRRLRREVRREERL